jgi:superfamily II DNA or RNA helicase
VLTQVSPTMVRIDGVPEAQLRPHLTYIDKSVDFELAKAKKSTWLINKLGEEGWRDHIDQLKAKRTQCLLFEDSKGFWTYSGLAKMLEDKFNLPFKNQVVYPEPKLIPWAKKPEKNPRPYQDKMRELLLAARHGAVEVGTGLGKSFVILLLAKELGLKTVVMTPSVSIAEQIYSEFKTHFGQKHVGQFFDGKKESKKLFTVAVDDSLTRIEEGSDHWNNLAKAQVFIADESHLCPAQSLAKVCTGLLSGAPYRFFFSGTQIRNDGLGLLLQAITGEIVFRMTVEEGVQQGWLAKPMFRVVPIDSSVNYYNPDANEMTRAHLYYEPNVCAKAAEIANLMVEEMDRQVVILVKEIEQLSWLLPHFRHPVKFAHGGVTDTTYHANGKVKKQGNKDKIPEEYWESDPNALVKEFNEGKIPILIGTSCITTGTDIQTVEAIIYLQGGKSEIQVKQSIGRGTRKPEGKTDCFFIDFDIRNVETLHRHAEARKEIYANVYPDFEEFHL